MLICPVCGGFLAKNNMALRCENGHSFDIAKEGYVNLLRSSRSGDQIGDDKYAARSGRDFLNAGYYSLLKDELCRIFSDKAGNVLDICCGEGYYTSALGENNNLYLYGFDISREMVRLASKRGNGTYFVANMAAIPVLENSFDYAIHLFAPFNESAFAKVLKPGGRLYSVVPGRMHLFGLKQAIYDLPYENDEKLPATDHLRLIGCHKVSGEIDLASQSDIQAVFRMTPYYFHTSQKDKDKLLPLHSLRTTIEFVVAEYEKPLEET